MATIDSSTKVDRIATIRGVFNECECFNRKAVMIIKVFNTAPKDFCAGPTVHPSSEELTPNQAVKVMAMAAERWGDEGVKGALCLLEKNFKRKAWHALFSNQRSIYPLAQLKLFRSFAAVPEKVALKTSLYVLDQLELCELAGAYTKERWKAYEEKPIETVTEGRVIDYDRIAIFNTHLYELIKIFLDGYQVDGASDVIERVRDHYNYRAYEWGYFRRELLEYLREKETSEEELRLVENLLKPEDSEDPTARSFDHSQYIK